MLFLKSKESSTNDPKITTGFYASIALTVGKYCRSHSNRPIGRSTTFRTCGPYLDMWSDPPRHVTAR